jgi:hypothetical protein
VWNENGRKQLKGPEPIATRTDRDAGLSITARCAAACPLHERDCSRRSA